MDRTPTSQTVRLIENDRIRRAFHSPKFFGSSGFSWGKVHPITDDVLERYPVGDPFLWMTTER